MSEILDRAIEGLGSKFSLPPTIEIRGADGEVIFAIHADGTVTGTVEDAGEAAEIFVRHVRQIIGRYPLQRPHCAGKDCARPRFPHIVLEQDGVIVYEFEPGVFRASWNEQGMHGTWESPTEALAAVLHHVTTGEGDL